MADAIWIGGAQSTYDIWTATVGGTIETSDLFIVRIGTSSLSVTAGSTSASTVASTIAAAYTATDKSIYREFAEYTAEASGSTVIFTAVTPGVPGIITVSTTESNGGAADSQTFSITNTQAATGPNSAGNVKNWKSGSLPGAGDNVFFKDTDISCLYDLDWESLNIAINGKIFMEQSYSGLIGLPPYTTAGYPEYRTQYLVPDVDGIYVGQGSTGNGSSLIRVLSFATTPEVIVYSTGTPLNNNISAFDFGGTVTSMRVFSGSTSFDYYLVPAAPNEVSSINMSGGNLYIGRNVTLSGTQNIDGNANIVIDAAHVGTMNMVNAGTVICNAAIGTINAYSGNLFIQGSGGTKILVGNNGRVSLANSTANISLSGGLELLQGAVFDDPRSSLATSTSILWNACNMTNTQVNLGAKRTLSISS